MYLKNIIILYLIPLARSPQSDSVPVNLEVKEICLPLRMCFMMFLADNLQDYADCGGLPPAYNGTAFSYNQAPMSYNKTLSVIYFKFNVLSHKNLFAGLCS